MLSLLLLLDGCAQFARNRFDEKEVRQSFGSRRLQFRKNCFTANFIFFIMLRLLIRCRIQRLLIRWSYTIIKFRIIEMHDKSVTEGLSLSLSLAQHYPGDKFLFL